MATSEALSAEWASKTERFFKNIKDSADVLSKEKELIQQQEGYDNMSQYYDKGTPELLGYRGHILTAEFCNKFYGNGDKNIKILDIGAGTGLVAEELRDKYGFQNIYGMDINEKLLMKAQAKNCYKGLYLGDGSNLDRLNLIFDNSFDLIVSGGTFFVSKSHPGADYFPQMCRMVKPGGRIIIVTAKAYSEEPWVEWDRIKDLERGGRIKIHPVEHVEQYKSGYDGVVLVYDVLV